MALNYNRQPEARQEERSHASNPREVKVAFLKEMTEAVRTLEKAMENGQRDIKRITQRAPDLGKVGELFSSVNEGVSGLTDRHDVKLLPLLRSINPRSQPLQNLSRMGFCFRHSFPMP